jgi:hypothetical protein
MTDYEKEEFWMGPDRLYETALEHRPASHRRPLPLGRVVRVGQVLQTVPWEITP